MSRTFRKLARVALVLMAGGPPALTAQTAHIREEVRTIPTYPFSEPNPVPMLTRDARLYPYHSFEGYSTTSEPKEWKVVHLENDYIEVFVLPQVGGKVWGAVVKETGHEFIYRNEVLKFRNIALRGPWTSGGIEFNFGVIGHTPSTATPVDYLLRENEDGSVSCFVGSMDLPSRTHWRVEIRLPADRAYFETNVVWYNPTPLEQAYYNWMTGAAFARDDLEMTIPGTRYLTHPGEARGWPVDAEGRYLPLYRNNTFEGHKSYHVVGELNDFFGGYYADEDYGFGHWAPYEDMPGQKLWLWALSREGGVWEDLLTDTDGQYVEFQAGRLFNQYSPDATVNPITQAAFDPMSESRWSETWFPLEKTGGLTDASRDGALYASAHDGVLTIGVNSFRAVDDTLRVWADGEILAAIPAQMKPLGRLHTTVDLGGREHYRVSMDKLALAFDSDPAGRLLSRPFSTDGDAAGSIPEADRNAAAARELLKARRYAEARELFESVLNVEPWHREALLGMADLSYRAGRYETGLEIANRALQLDAYDAKANFLAGILYRALGRNADAHDAFGWAARSTGFRSAAYTQLAEMEIAAGGLGEATRFARLAIDYDRYSVPAWRALAVVGRLSADRLLAEEARDELSAVDPLHHFVRAERYLSDLTPRTASELGTSLGGEYPEQSLLELAVGYVHLGLPGDALAILGSERAPLGAVEAAWKAYLQGEPEALPTHPDPAFQFPFRRESLPVLAWADEHSAEWVWTYLRALNLWAMDRSREAAALLLGLGDEPDYAPFYVARAELLKARDGTDPLGDLKRAVALDPRTRQLHVSLIRHLQDVGEWSASLESSAAARALFPDDFNLALLEARGFIHSARAEDAVRILSGVEVLPSESGRESHRLWEQAHTLAALDALDAGDAPRAAQHLRSALEWPERLGQGRPYQPEERLVRFLLGRVEERLRDEEAAAREYTRVVDATGVISDPPTRLDLLAVGALAALGRRAALTSIRSEDLGDSPAALVLGGLSAAATASGSAQSASRALAQEAERAARRHPSLFDDLEGRMIVRAFTTGR